MNKNIVAIASWLIVAWICKVFLFSLPYKFSAHPDTLHIFGTIGAWMKGFLGETIGNFFGHYAFYLVGSFELLTSLVLLVPAIIWLAYKMGIAASPNRPLFHKIGGLMASAVMLGAVFFHLFTPLGIEVIHEGKSDGGSLFYAAVSIFVLGVVLFLINARVRSGVR